MSKLAHPYKCNGCEKLRTNDANHWWLLWFVADEDYPEGELSLCKWDEEWAQRDDVRHVCGQECASLLVSRWMATGSFDPPSARPLTSPLSPSATEKDSSTPGETK